MSNLSDLLPAGGGAKVITATASGNLATGQTVILQSDGTVKVVEQTTISEAKGTAVEFESGTTAYTAAAYDTNKNKVLVAYKDSSDSGQGKAVVGTVSGTSITFNTPKVFRNSSNVTGTDYIAVAFDSTRNNFAVVYQANYLNRLQGKILTIQDDGTWNDGSFTTIVGNQVSYIAIAYSPTQDKFLVSYRDHNSSNYGRNLSLTSNGNTFSVGTPNTFTSNTVEFIDNVYGNTTDDRFVVAYKRSSTAYAASCYISGTQIVNQAEYQVQSSNSDQTTVGYDTAAGRYVVAYRDETDSDKIGLKSFAVTTSASAGASTITAVSSEVNTTNTSCEDYAIAYDSNVQKLSLFYRSGTTSYVQKITDSSETGLALGSAFTLDATSNTNASAVYDPDSKNFVYTYSAAGASNEGKGQVFQPTYAVTNSDNFVGITNQAINNSASGEVVVEGGVITNSALLPFAYTGTTGSAAVFESATSNSFGIAFDSSNNKVVVTYDDEGNSSYGTAVVGTVSGTSISWGTPVVFNSGNINGSNCWTAFDSNVNKTVTIFRDNGNSEYGTAIVGTVSGTSISFGTKAVYNSASAYATASDICFDSTQNKLLICYRDVGNNHYGTAIVGTISGTSISFGTEVVFDSTQVEMIGCVHDPSTGKNVVANKEGSGNNGVARVATISGTSVSFGSQATFNSTSTYYINAVYDSNSNKVVLCYENNGGGNLGQAKVCTISGTSISFGTAATFSEAGDAVNWVTAGFDSNQNRVVVATVATPQTISRFNSGAVSGTDITFGTPQTFLSGNAYPLGQRIVFDTSQNTNVWVYKDNANSQYGTGIAMQLSGANPTLTVGSTYYVQDDGTLSTTSSSVTAGKAIANTTLLLKG